MPAAEMMLANPHNAKADTDRFCNQANTRPAPAQAKAKPVSYTHLDVYKRQLLDCMPPIPDPSPPLARARGGGETRSDPSQIVSDFTALKCAGEIMHGTLLKIIAAAVWAIAALPGPASAQTLAQAAKPVAPAKPEMAESCPGLIASRSPFQAALERVALAADQVRISYIGHSTFQIESPLLVRVATDYNDYVKPPVLPLSLIHI